MRSPITATIVVEGDPPLLAGYRARVNELLGAESDAPYRELHTASQLDYRLKSSGVPYPPFVQASSEFPELTVRVKWQNPVGGTCGNATIRAGRLVDQSAGSAAAADRAVDVRAGQDGTIVLAIACRRRRAGEWIGYALTARQHAFFRVSGDGAVLEAADGAEPEWAERWTVQGDSVAYAELGSREPLDEPLAGDLERLAHEFADEWLWFDEAPLAETAIERQRYADHALATNPVNLRVAKLRSVLTGAPGGGYVLEAAAPEARKIVALVARLWLQSARH
ncbi:MAG TPA: hypothetical protein VLD36_23945 [Burkholderiales bacterium]|nr:hypothetical protein [Burkholderiales bacterium]